MNKANKILKQKEKISKLEVSKAEQNQEDSEQCQQKKAQVPDISKTDEVQRDKVLDHHEMDHLCDVHKCEVDKGDKHLTPYLMYAKLMSTKGIKYWTKTRRFMYHLNRLMSMLEGRHCFNAGDTY